MDHSVYEQLILEGIKGLPRESLDEITDFIYFVRKRTFQPEQFLADLHQLGVRAELKQLSRDEDAHLEMEFKDYEQCYPHE